MKENTASDIAEFFPALQVRSSELYDTTILIGMVLVFVGLVMKTWKGSQGEPFEILRGIMSAGFLGAVVIPFFPDWVNEIQLMAHELVQSLDADPSKSYERFALIVANSSEADDPDAGFFDSIWSTFSGWGEALLVALVFLASKLALAIMWVFFIVQQAVVLFQVALGPVFLALFMMESTRGVAVKYLLVLGSVLLWPLGWGIADMLTSAMLDLYPSLGVAQTLVFILAITSWLIVSTIAGPFVISKLMTQGANAGAAFLASYGAALGQGVTYGVGAGTTASLAGGGRGAVAAAATVGGLGGLATGAAGNSGWMIPTAIGLGAAFSSDLGGGKSASRDYEAEAAEHAKKARS